MILFQFIGIPLLVLFVAITLNAAARRHLSWAAAVAWTIVWIGAAVAIAFPDSTTMRAANALGIDRGSDLVFYCAILAMMAGFFAVFVRFRRVERDLTEIVRRIEAYNPGAHIDELFEGMVKAYRLDPDIDVLAGELDLGSAADHGQRLRSIEWGPP